MFEYDINYNNFFLIRNVIQIVINPFEYPAVRTDTEYIFSYFNTL